MAENALNLSNYVYSKGFWTFISNNKNKYYDITNKYMNFKEVASIYSILDLLRFNEIFCVEYDLIEGCTNCGFKNISTNCYLPYFSYFEEDIISKKEIENIIISKFINMMSTCSICGFNYEKVYDINNPTFYRIFQKINLPKFIFIGFDLLNENDIDLDSNFNLSMETELEKRKKYNNNIIEILKFNFTLNNEIYI